MRKHRTRRLMAIFFALALMVGLFSGCGSSNNGPKCVDIVKAARNVVKEGTFDEWFSYGEDIYDNSFDTLYGVQFDMIDDGAVAQTSTGGVADEISIMHLKKNEEVSIAKKKMEDRIADRMQKFSGYKPEEVYKLENARVIIQGNYIALIISDENDTIEAEIRRVISEGVK